MATIHRFRWLCGIALAATIAAGATRLSAADPANTTTGSATPATASSSGIVDLFDAMHNGDLGVQFIARSSREATLILTNNTDQPLNVHLPEAFAAIPVLGQGGLGGAGAAGRTTGTGNNNKNQAVGSGTQNNQQRPGGFGGAVANGQGGAANAQGANGANAGAFSIPPERVVKLKLPTVCLEYGKASPSAHIPYMIVPIETYTSNLEVQELCRMLGTGTLDQQSAQAAAWHLANHLSWEKLADMKHFPHNSGFTSPVFSSDQMRAAMALTDKAIKMADARTAASPKPAPSTSIPANTSTSSAPAPKSAGLN
jgi:hypothetical protein